MPASIACTWKLSYVTWGASVNVHIQVEKQCSRDCSGIVKLNLSTDYKLCGKSQSEGRNLR